MKEIKIIDHELIPGAKRWIDKDGNHRESISGYLFESSVCFKIHPSEEGLHWSEQKEAGNVYSVKFERDNYTSPDFEEKEELFNWIDEAVFEMEEEDFFKKQQIIEEQKKLEREDIQNHLSEKQLLEKTVDMTYKALELPKIK